MEPEKAAIRLKVFNNDVALLRCSISALIMNHSTPLYAFPYLSVS